MREWYLESTDKQGDQPCTLEVHRCVVPLLRLVIQLHPAGFTKLALAKDTSTLGQHFTVLSIPVVICGSAISGAVPTTGKNHTR